MRGLTDEEREVLDIFPCSPEACLHDDYMSADECTVSERLQLRGLIEEVKCEVDVRPIGDGIVEVFFHDRLTPLGRYVLHLDAMARGLTVPV
jgi:hypothetical protein